MSLFFLSRVLLTPPKTPRNVFFPWHTMSIHLSGSFLESRRLALRVPVTLTKPEIRRYLEGLYGAKVLKVNTLIKVPERRRNLEDKRLGYRRAGCTYKKAIVTLEEAVPPEVQMLRSSRNLSVNPDKLKKNVSYGANRDLKRRPTREQQTQGGEMQHAWTLPIPNLLAGDDLPIHPTHREDPSSTLEAPDIRLPFRHGGVYNFTFKPQEVPQQTPVPLDLRPWRHRLSNSQNRTNN
ncbi:ribosomal protein L23, putative [Eimeria acervulina]|uniref:Large ribosomal subunit protein uL23m n=1 Tax=Eimeria acervulina TaxID=5801 RepID=U6GWE4_EIMAC|nr:ribosomal protein L23, putative [Eimeria acervulina]CDI83573.1 ribosomal protein L23, putative [Eimeria acervulina]